MCSQHGGQHEDTYFASQDPLFRIRALNLCYWEHWQLAVLHCSLLQNCSEPGTALREDSLLTQGLSQLCEVGLQEVKAEAARVRPFCTAPSTPRLSQNVETSMLQLMY